MKKQARSTEPRAEAETARDTRRRVGFRRLAWNEIVRPGAYAADQQNRLQLWEGPTGFRAGSFVKPIYRKGRFLRARLISSKRIAGTEKHR